jgi:hypothetical protein
MGMVATYRAVSERELERLRGDPDAADDFFYGADLLDDVDAMLRREAEETAAGRRLSLEKDWHALQFLLTGDAALDLPPDPAPPASVVLGGSETEWEASYGQVRLLSADQVAAAAAALRAIPLAELQRRFDPARFDAARIYPGPSGGWTGSQVQSLWEIYPKLVAFFERAAADRAVILFSLD